MAGLLSLFIMTTLLGLGSFAVGMLPLSFALSKPALARLTTFGGGLLLGTALGVIIPEGVETIVLANSSRFFPSRTIALSLIGGFKAMLVIERLISRFSKYPHDHSSHSPLPVHEASSTEAPMPETSDGQGHVEFDVELGELERTEGLAEEPAPLSSTRASRIDANASGKTQAYPLTLGLVVHALADGLALGSAAVSPVDTGLSFVIFLALLVHKAPTALALTTSLLSTTLPRSECRKHLAVFSASTPIGALVIYALLSLVPIKSESSWTGIALLVSGGTFLYVATVLQPGKASADDVSERTRLPFLVLGMLVPVGINTFLSHDH